MSHAFAYAVGVVTGGVAVLVVTAAALVGHRNTRNAMFKDLGWIK